uniref:Discs, large homolog 5b (Drosophila), tandem duplicate 1 n=1 Tax=Scleropages formosus TaxID=113540 RepID=A0A8C9S090_SCLFO
MDPKHRELLEQSHQNLLESITDADRLAEELGRSGALSALERRELESNCSSNSDKVELLLKMLLSKEKDHFQELRVALEKTHPHLSSALLVNGAGPVDHSSGTTGKASSPPPALTENKPVNEKLETVLFQLRQVTRERDELRKRLALSSPGTTFDDCRPNSRTSHDYERLKMQCMKAMADLQSLQNQHTKTLRRCEEAVKEADFYHTLHSRLLSDQSQLKEEMDAMKRDNSQLIREHNHLKQNCEELRRMHDEDQKEVADMRLQQQQVIRESGSSEILNKLYDTAMDKLEGVKKDYEALRKRYNEKTSNHNADLSRLEQVEEENRRLQKQIDMLMKQRDTAIHYQQQYSSSLRRFDSVQQELNKTVAQNKELQREVERWQSEATRYKTLQLKAVKESEKYKEERDSVFNEYRLIMSERDQVIKEVDKLQTGLEMAEAKLKNTSSERKVASEEMEALRQKQDSATLDMERANKEIEMLRKQCEAMSQELKEAVQEADVAKCRRDWAFQERDKIVAERESIRTLCDNLRRERDRAVSDLAEALRNLDDMRKQKNDVSRELKELKEKMENQLEKEARFRQLMAHNSHDSAIDTDSLEWETEVVEFEKDREDMDLKALGFDVAEGVNDPYLPGDCGIFVTKVDKGSIADGRLRVNDWLLKINDVDLTNKDRKQVIKAVLNGGGVINMVVRRRKSLGGRIITPIHLNIAGHKDCGISLESGVFVAAVVPGSPAAREGSLALGDRLIAVSAAESRDSLDFRLFIRFYQIISWIRSYSGQNIFENLRDSEKASNGRLHSSEVHVRNCRNLKHNSSTQTDIFNPSGTGEGKEERGDPEEAPFCHLKPLSTGSLHTHTQGPFSADAFQERCYGSDKRQFTFDPAVDSCVLVEAGPEKSPAQKRSGGTWPKMVVGVTASESAQLSIFKMPKQRKSIFEAEAFKRPDAASKLDYLPPGQLAGHSPPAPATPPTPPARSDSFKFKHKQQTSSASDSTITKGSPPSTPTPAPGSSQEPGLDARDRNGNHYFTEGLESKALPSRKSCDEDVGRQRVEEPEVKRPRPKSAPALRRKMTPLQIPLPTLQVMYSAHRGLAPCPAVTAVMRNPIYTAWSHRVHTNNCPSVPNFILMCRFSLLCDLSPQHQGRLSLDLSHKRSGDFSEPSRSRAPHGTNSLPSSARLGSSSNLQLRTERIKIPSTPRYPRSMLGSDRGFLSHSECSSPSLITPPQSPLNLETTSFTSSQSQSSISTLPRISVSPVPIGERRKDRPYLEEPRSVIVHKGAEPLGISIVSGENGGIFVSKVTGGSIAHQAGLEYGDQLLEYNGINLRNATEQQARLIIGQQCDTITILAQYNPHMYQLGNHSRSSSRMEPISTQSTPQGSGATTPDNHSTIDTLSEQDEGTMTPPSKQTTPTTMHPDTCRKVPDPRTITLRRTQGELGIQICGGNLLGIFVEKLEDDSIARGPDGLMPGDMILEYNSVQFKNKTAEEAYLEMLKPTETVTLKVQYRINEFTMLKDTPGDAFYIRALYDRVAEMELDLSFKKDDILFVEDTLPKGNFVMFRELSNEYSMSEMKDENGSSKTLSAAARRSFFRRKNKHKRSGSKDGKDLLALDAISTDSIPFMEDCVSLAYQRVQKVESASPRPVLILGPLVDAVKDMLVKESPGKFCRCVLEVMKASQQAIERGVKDCLFIDYKRRSGHFDVTTVASIKEITEKDCHCLLDIAPHAIERLHSVHIYPIVIFIRYKNAKQIKEQKDPVFLRDKVSQKHSKEQFEVAQKMEQEYSKFFTGIVQGGSLSYICTQIVTIVDQEQSKVLWIPDGSA